MLWLLAMLLGLVLGLGAGGRLGNLARLRFQWPWLVVAAVVVRAAIEVTPLNRVEGAQYVYLLALLAIVAWTVWHVRLLPGVWLVSAGGLLNLLVIAANGARMPVASQYAGSLLQRGHVGQYTLMTPSTQLNALGDWISLSPFPGVYSPGDLLVALGLALVLLVATHREPETDGLAGKSQDV